MIRLCLTAEGQTEQQFSISLLVPHLASRGVCLSKPRLAETSRKKRKRGGLLKYEVVKNDIQRWLKQERGDDVCFTTMFDLYGLPRDFPGYCKAAAIPDKYARVKSLERSFCDDVNDRRFIPYFQLHEFEAILFADPGEFRSYFDDCDSQIQALMKMLEEAGNPELIDDGEHTAPSKRIIGQFQDYGGLKPVAAPIIAQAIGLDRIRSKCRHFDEWLTKLEQLGSSQ